MEDNLRGWRDAVFLHRVCIGRYTKDEKWMFFGYFSADFRHSKVRKEEKTSA